MAGNSPVSSQGRRTPRPCGRPGGAMLAKYTAALLDRLTHHVHILEMNGDSYRLRHSRQSAAYQVSDEPEDS